METLCVQSLHQPRAIRKVAVDGRIKEFTEQLDDKLARVVGTDRTLANQARLQAAFRRIRAGKYRNRVAAQFSTLKAVWEML